ncbi:NADH-quinone oxidoreductase subunit H [Vulcanisaeta sp. EB80]|uniref:NADH-quinone oxidoreductase subunit NuoH n=1 Tax=Vulcanisaeta sp. EB80 TaxID=1650660 RepID=UPI0009BDB4AA|nr:NADH-quinone oxidoreductase subunit NuoH [Vulcanisaeta sp. EB80]PLC68324.1 NADH-quinone oxidoreductase subunit H [Vulcanisaeta sp. EB80]
MRIILSIVSWASSLISGIFTSAIQLIYSIIQYILTRPEVNIPFLNPIIDFLNKVPIINIIVHLILWRPIFDLLFAPGLVSVIIALIYIIWFERKITAKVQWRIGPLEVSRPIGGFLQPFADLFRYTFQEFVVPQQADRNYFIHAPAIVFILSTLPIFFIPIGPMETNGVVNGIYGIYTGYDVLIALALITLFNVGIILIGWASNDRFTYIGTVREALLYTGYETVLILSAISILLIYGTADPFKIVDWQVAHLPGIIINPLAFLAFVIATLMATSRFPFEISEADTEIVLGPYTEYSGVIYGLVMTMSYEKLYVLSLLIVLLFLNGWAGPYIPPLGALSYAIWFGIKTYIVMMILVFTRAVYGRYRPDQALKMSWSSLLGLAVASLILSLIIKLL